MNSKIISRTSLDLGDSHIRTIRTGRGKLIYKYTGKPSAKEIKEIDDSLRGAFNMCDYCINKLEKGNEKTNKSFEAIFQKQLDKNSKQSLIQNYKAILQKLISKIVILRESVFVDENGNAVETVLSGANPSEGKTIKIYDAFFKNAKGDDKLLNSRSTVIVHEVAHLIGLHSDEETEMINSAESIRNFTLLACNLVSEKDLFAESGDINSYNPEKKLVGKDGELPYDPNQPRAPKGVPTGGQWVKAGEGGSGGSSSGGSRNTGYTEESGKGSKQNLNYIENLPGRGLGDDGFIKRFNPKDIDPGFYEEVDESKIDPGFVKEIDESKLDPGFIRKDLDILGTSDDSGFVYTFKDKVRDLFVDKYNKAINYIEELFPRSGVGKQMDFGPMTPEDIKMKEGIVPRGIDGIEIEKLLPVIGAYAGGEIYPKHGGNPESIQIPYNRLPRDSRDENGVIRRNLIADGSESQTQNLSAKSDEDLEDSQANTQTTRGANSETKSGSQEIKTEKPKALTLDEAKDLISWTLDAFEKEFGNGKGILNSDDAKDLLLKTAIQESGLMPRDQDGGGPAKGLMQIEKSTFDDMWNRYLNKDDSKFLGGEKTLKDVKEWIEKICTFAGENEIKHENLNKDNVLSILLARLRYIYDNPEKIPSKDDIVSQGNFYTKYFQRGSQKDRIDRANKFIKNNKDFLKKK